MTGVAIVGAAETTDLGRIPDMGELQLHADAAINTMADACLTAKDIDGVATAGASPTEIAHYLGITPRWVDGTSVGGCSFMLHVRHAVAAIQSGQAETVLITHGESGRSGVGRLRPRGAPSASLSAQFEGPYGVMGPTTMFTIGVLRYMKEYGLTHEQLAMVAVVQREWAAMNPRASFRDPITVDDVLESRIIAYPFHLLECCLVTDGGGALILTILGTGESVETPIISQMENLCSSRAFRVAGLDAMNSAGINHGDVDHMMAYDAFAHLPIWGLEDLGFCKKGEAARYIEEGNTRPGGKLPLNTNGGGLSFMHSGMYGMYALQESVRQIRGTAAAQVDGAEVSLCLGVGGMFAAAGCIVMATQPH
jgi:acetyl-CoA acetyltransferase